MIIEIPVYLMPLLWHKVNCGIGKSFKEYLEDTFNKSKFYNELDTVLWKTINEQIVNNPNISHPCRDYPYEIAAINKNNNKPSTTKKLRRIFIKGKIK
jgi:hypothetical protein